MMGADHRDAQWLHRAALLALRGHGHVEPNPMVGCIITDARGEIVAMGHHERFGGPHAEINALRSAGERARGGTMYVTLEPCAHQGKTPPCADAIIRAGIARVVMAQHDPTSTAGGGAPRLRQTGIAIELNDCSALANEVSAPFRHRARTGLPWVVAKIALTGDGRLITQRDEPRWITNETSRRWVHRERGRCDAIITGIGTILADDPLLTARGVRARREALRVVVDSDLRLPIDSKIVQSAKTAPLVVACTEASLAQHEDRVQALSTRGVELVPLPARDERIALESLLRWLARERCITTAMLECGPRLLASMARGRLVHQGWIFIGGGARDETKTSAVADGFMRNLLGERSPLSIQSVRRRRDDLILLYRVG